MLKSFNWIVNLAQRVTGILGVANGGTGTSTSFTTGSVLFTGSAGVYTQNNANFFWDNTNARLGLGTSASEARLHIRQVSAGTVPAMIILANPAANSAGTGAEIRFYVNDGTVDRYASIQSVQTTAGNVADLRFFTSNSSTPVERMRLDYTGSLVLGTADSAITSGVGVKIRPGLNGSISTVDSRSTNVDVGFVQYSTSAAAYRFYVDWGGTIHATSATISAISDIRLKENVRDLDAGLNMILALKPRRFDWKPGKGKDILDDMGFIAQEVEEVVPALIDRWMPGEGEPDDLKSVRAGDLIPVLVKAIQELAAEVAELKASAQSN